MSADASADAFGSLLARQTPSPARIPRADSSSGQSFTPGTIAQTHTICLLGTSVHSHTPSCTTSQNGVLQYAYNAMYLLGKVPPNLCHKMRRSSAEPTPDAREPKGHGAMQSTAPFPLLRSPAGPLATRLEFEPAAAVCGRACRCLARAPAALAPPGGVREPQPGWLQSRFSGGIIPKRQHGNWIALTHRAFFCSPRAADPTKKISHHKS